MSNGRVLQRRKLFGVFSDKTISTIHTGFIVRYLSISRRRTRKFQIYTTRGGLFIKPDGWKQPLAVFDFGENRVGKTWFCFGNSVKVWFIFKNNANQDALQIDYALRESCARVRVMTFRGKFAWEIAQRPQIRRAIIRLQTYALSSIALLAKTVL